MKLSKWKIITLLEKHKKITAVAEELQVKQPTVSFHMKNMEAEYGVPLFEARMGRILLTEAGQALYHYAVKIVGLMEDAEKTLSEFRTLERGSLKIGASLVAGTYLLPPLISDFSRHHPNIHISILVKPTSQIWDMLSNYEVDVALLNSESVEISNIIYEELFEDEMVVIFAPRHDFCGISELTMDQLVKEPFIQHAEGSSLKDFSIKWMTMNQAHLWTTVELDSPEAVKMAVKRGNAISFFSKMGIADEVARGELCYLPVPGKKEDNRFVMGHRKDQIITPLSRSFMDFIVENTSSGLSCMARCPSSVLENNKNADPDLS